MNTLISRIAFIPDPPPSHRDRIPACGVSIRSSTTIRPLSALWAEGFGVKVFAPGGDQTAVKSFILWDHDGVLVETEPWYFKATRLSIAELGVTLLQSDYLRDMAHGRSAWERALASGATETQVTHHKAERNRLYQQYLLEQDIEIPGVEQILSQLAARYSMAIVTTAKREDFDLIHAERNIVEHMNFVLTSGDYPRSKPAPDPYIAALQRFNAAPEDAIVVEDSERGLRAAVAAGIDCVVVANEFVAGQNLSAAAHHINSLSELPELLGSL